VGLMTVNKMGFPCFTWRAFGARASVIFFHERSQNFSAQKNHSCGYHRNEKYILKHKRRYHFLPFRCSVFA
jgi:hypothetical protein